MDRRWPWAPAEDALLRQLYAAGRSRPEIATVLSRTVPAINRRAGALGLRRAKPRDWTPRDENRLMDLLETHVPYARIARRLGRSVDAIKTRCGRHLGYRLTTSGAAHPISRVAEMVFGTHRKAQTVSRWVERGWLRAVPSGVERIRVVEYEDLLDFLGREEHWHLWSPERLTDSALRDWAIAERRGLRFLTVDQVAKLWSLTESAVRRRIHHGHLPAVQLGAKWLIRSDHAFYTDLTSRHGRPRRRFTPEEDLFLRQHYGAETLAWIGERLSRHPTVVQARAGLLGCRLDPVDSPGRVNEAGRDLGREEPA